LHGPGAVLGLGYRRHSRCRVDEEAEALGDAAAGEATRRTIEYLLHEPDDVPLEGRLQHLLSGTKSFAMTGFKEALLTRVLCVMYPDRS
jgi:hypothetical protein